MEVKQLISQINLATVFEGDLGQPVRSGRWLIYRCPCHEDRNPSLAIAPDRRRWVCFGRCNTSGDAVDWMQKRQGLSFGESCKQLEAMIGVLPKLPKVAAQPTVAVPNAESPPPKEWQDKARETIRVHRIKSTKYDWRVRDYLTQRCLYDSTWDYWQLGHNGLAGNHDGLWVPRGILIPWIERNQVWAVKVRLTDHKEQGVRTAPKYSQIAGGRPAIFGLHTIGNHSAIIITEGEFDAMLIHQLAGDLVGVVTLGSAASQVGWSWLREFLPVKHILAAQDADGAGNKAALWWQAMSARVRRVQVPIGKDVTEFAQAGGHVRTWVQRELDKLGRAQ